jgi:hypothetical protein
MAETLREYVNSLGWEIDDASQAKFENAITKSVTLAIGLEHALEGMAKKTIAAFEGMTDAYEDLANKSEVLGQSVKSMKAFTFAAQQAGASVSEINGFIDSLISRQRNFGDSKSILGQIFHVDPNSPTLLKDTIESLGKMDKMTAAAYSRNSVAGLHIGPSLLDASHRASFEKYAREEAERQARLPEGFAENAAQGARRLNQAWRDLAETINGVVTSAFANLTGESGPIEAIQAFERWLQAHSGEIAEAISKLVTNVTQFVEAFASIATGVDSTDPKIKAMVETFNAWGASLKNLEFWLKSIAALITGTGILTLFGLMAGVLGVVGTGGIGALVMGGVGLAAAVGGAYAAYTGIKALTAGGESETAPGEGRKSDGATSSGNDHVGAAATGGSAHPATRAQMMSIAMDQLRKEGVPEANLRGAAAMLVGQADMESGLVPTKTHDNGTGFGIYGARLNRRDEMLRWMREHGFAPNSAEGQMRQMAYAAVHGWTGAPPAKAAASRNIIMSGATNVGSVNAFTGAFESPAIINARHGAVAQAYRTDAPAGQPTAYTPGSPPSGMSMNDWIEKQKGKQPTLEQLGVTAGAGWGGPKAPSSLATIGAGDQIPRALKPFYDAATGRTLSSLGGGAAGVGVRGGRVSTVDDIWAAIYSMLGIDHSRYGDNKSTADMKALGKRVGDWLKSEVNSFGDTLIAHLATGVDNDATMNAFRNALGMNQARAEAFRGSGPDLMGGVGHGRHHQYTVPKNPRSFEQMHAMTKLAPLGSIGTQRPNLSNTQHNNITINGADDAKGVMDELHWNTKRLWPMHALRNTTTAAS